MLIKLWISAGGFLIAKLFHLTLMLYLMNKDHVAFRGE